MLVIAEPCNICTALLLTDPDDVAVGAAVAEMPPMPSAFTGAVAIIPRRKKPYP